MDGLDDKLTNTQVQLMDGLQVPLTGMILMGKTCSLLPQGHHQALTRLTPRSLLAQDYQPPASSSLGRPEHFVRCCITRTDAGQ